MDIAIWLRHCYEQAMYSSHDNNTKNCAIILDRGQQYVGVNRFPEGVAVTPARLVKPLKLKYIIHAEQMAILRAASNIKDATMICPYASCTECAKSIIQSGIKTLIRHADIMDIARKNSDKNIVEFDLADSMLREGGVEIVDYAGSVGAAILFDGIVRNV